MLIVERNDQGNIYYVIKTEKPINCFTVAWRISTGLCLNFYLILFHGGIEIGLKKFTNSSLTSQL